MISYSEIKERKYIIYENEPYEVLSSHIFRKQQRKPVNQTKLRNVRTGKVTEQTFHQADKVEEADLSRKEVIYLYTNAKSGEIFFCDVENRGNRFAVDSSLAGGVQDYTEENGTVDALVFEEEIIGIKLPLTIDLPVAEAPPNVKGNSASGTTKPVTMTTGLMVNAPLFIEVGDVLRVHTDDARYMERVSKA
ncbi:MAG: elongation factor P [Flavobacteriaceae bacterium]|jgi:elongation factor P